MATPFEIKEEEKKPKTLIFWALLSAKLLDIHPKPPKKKYFFQKLFCHRVEPKELRGQCPNLQDFKQSFGWGMHFCFFFACLVFEVLQCWEVGVRLSFLIWMAIGLQYVNNAVVWPDVSMSIKLIFFGQKSDFSLYFFVEIGGKNQSKTIIWCEKLIWIPGEWGNSKMNILFWMGGR